MTTRTNVEVIPATTFTTTIYVADDGQEFYHEDDCRRHEEYIRTMQHPVFATCIENAETLDGYKATLYYISNKEDLQFFCDHARVYKYTCDFDKFGSGWYLYYCIDGGDYDDDIYLLNYDNYKAEREKELIDWEQKMQNLMSMRGYHE